MEILTKLLTWIAIGMAIMFSIGMVIAILDTFKAAGSSTYRIYQNRRTWYTNEYVEKDNCLKFMDNVDKREAVVCGTYSIEGI